MPEDLTDKAAAVEPGAVARKLVVILIHGIRDYGDWMTPLANELRKTEIDCRPFSESRVSGFFLLLPKWARNKFERRVRERLARLIANHKDNDLVIFAHSYGTYLLSETIKDNPRLKIKRAVFYGSIIDREYNWYYVADCFGVENASDLFPILNCCGNRDTWPVAAECMSTDYGSSGTRGFMNGHFRDFYSEGDHSAFLQTVLAKPTWLPYLTSGTLPSGDQAVPLPHNDVVAQYSTLAFFWVTCGVRHFFGLIYKTWTLILLALAVAAIWWSVLYFQTSNCSDRTDVTFEEFVADFDKASASPAEFRVFSEPFSDDRCWHVKWQLRIKNGSTRDDPEQYILAEPVSKIDGLKHIDLSNIQIICDLAGGKNWDAFQIGEQVTVEGDTKQILPKQIYLYKCRVSKQEKAATNVGAPHPTPVAEGKAEKQLVAPPPQQVEIWLTKNKPETIFDNEVKLLLQYSTPFIKNVQFDAIVDGNRHSIDLYFDEVERVVEGNYSYKFSLLDYAGDQAKLSVVKARVER